ncbi:hypothetical protein VYU27_009989 [Nannochloropsis oceanica]
MPPTLRPRPAASTGNSRSSTPTKASAESTQPASPSFPTLVHEYVLATRPWTFTASLVPLLLTTAILFQHSAASSDLYSLPPSLPSFLSAMGALLLVHAASNLTNTYFDFVSGRDTKKEAGDRALVDRKHVTERGVLILAVVLYGLATALVASTLAHSAYHDALLLFAAGALLSFFYTSPPFHFKCRALGDVVIYLCFGPLLTQFTALLLLAPPSLPPSYLHLCHLPVGLLTEGILHANNTRDIAMDKKSGTVTLAGLLGFAWSRRMFIGLVVGAYASSLFLAYRWLPTPPSLPSSFPPSLPRSLLFP